MFIALSEFCLRCLFCTDSTGSIKLPPGSKKTLTSSELNLIENLYNWRTGKNKPLTQRRIHAIVKAARAKGDAVAYDGTTYLAKVDYIKGLINGKGGLNGAARQSALDFFDVKIRNTIDSLDKEFEGLGYGKVGGDNAAFKKHIKDKTGLDVDVEKIFSDLKAKNTVKDPVGKGGVINIDDINNVHDEFFEPAKQKIGELLKTLVKKSVDLFIEATNRRSSIPTIRTRRPNGSPT